MSIHGYLPERIPPDSVFDAEYEEGRPVLTEGGWKRGKVANPKILRFGLSPSSFYGILHYERIRMIDPELSVIRRVCNGGSAYRCVGARKRPVSPEWCRSLCWHDPVCARPSRNAIPASRFRFPDDTQIFWHELASRSMKKAIGEHLERRKK